MLFSALIVLGIIFRCGELNTTPFDPDNPSYKKTQITILLDSTAIDSLFYTDTPVRIGISVTAKQIMDRLTKIIVDYGNSVVFEKQKPENHNLLEPKLSDSAS